MSNRILWIDLIKVIATLSVVLLHVAAALVLKMGKIDFSDWMAGNIFDSITRMAVPLFFMVSGVLLLNGKEEPLSTFFKKRFLKVFIPLILWSFIYILFKIHALNQDINIVNNILLSLHRPEYWHLWFLYAIIGIYLFLPVLKVFINHSTQNIQIYFIILWIFSVAIIPFSNYFTGTSIKIDIPAATGYIGYLVLGYQLAKISITRKLYYISIIFIILSTLGTIFGTLYLSEKSGRFIHFFYDFNSITTIIQAISYFIVLKYIGETKLKKSNFIATYSITAISISSLGIYLIHPMYIYFLGELGITVFLASPLIMVPVITGLTFILSFITIFIIQNIKMPKYLPIAKFLVP